MARCYGTNPDNTACERDGGKAGWCGECRAPAGYAALAADVIAPDDADRVRGVWARLHDDEPDDTDTA